MLSLYLLGRKVGHVTCAGGHFAIAIENSTHHVKMHSKMQYNAPKYELCKTASASKTLQTCELLLFLFMPGTQL
jgi:hypothetical protein